MISNRSIETMLSRPPEKQASQESASSVNGSGAQVVPTLGEATRTLLAELEPGDREHVCQALAWLSTALDRR